MTTDLVTPGLETAGLVTLESIPEPEKTAPPVLLLRDLLTAWDLNAEALYEARRHGQAPGAITGLASLDRELCGYLAPGLHVLHGTPGAGKTAFALQVASNCNCSCLYVTCEMEPLELLRRLVARLTGTFLGRFKTGELTPMESGLKARQAIEQLPHLAIMDGTQAYVTGSHLLNTAGACRQLSTSPYLLVVMDSVHAWAESAPGVATEYDSLNAHLTALRQLGARLAAPILAIAERNRESMGRGGLNASAGSRRFEYSAESVFDLERSKADPPSGAAGAVPVELTLVKNRAGAAGSKISLLFNGAIQTFVEASYTGARP